MDTIQKKDVRKNLIKKIPSVLEGAFFIWGILFASWSPILIVLGYWLAEVLGFLYTIISLIITKIRSNENIHLAKYIFIYGFFLFGHTVFVIILAGVTSSTDPISEKFFTLFWGILLLIFTGKDTLISISFMKTIKEIFYFVLATGFYSFIQNTFIRKTKVSDLINHSFGPIIVTHFIIVFGLGAIIMTKANNNFAIILILIKVFIDLSGFSDKGAKVID